ncbi:MAG TPA: hypothetical protein VNA25_08850 [Phycisphaerae bacterium]|nr:hypothetical protein [Phycisphaerae bacterium]
MRRRTYCHSRLSHIGKAIALYTAEHDERWPMRLADLPADYDYVEPKDLVCPSSGTEMPAEVLQANDMLAAAGSTDYVYVPLYEPSDSQWIAAFELPANHGQGYANELYSDIHVGNTGDMSAYLREIQITNEATATERRRWR